MVAYYVFYGRAFEKIRDKVWELSALDLTSSNTKTETLERQSGFFQVIWTSVVTGFVAEIRKKLKDLVPRVSRINAIANSSPSTKIKDLLKPRNFNE